MIGDRHFGQLGAWWFGVVEGCCSGEGADDVAAVAEDLAALTCVTTDSTFRAANVVLLWDRDESGEY